MTGRDKVINDELKLVDQRFAKHEILGPDIRLIVRQEIPQPKMLRHRKTSAFSGGDLDEPVRVRVLGRP